MDTYVLTAKSVEKGSSRALVDTFNDSLYTEHVLMSLQERQSLRGKPFNLAHTGPLPRHRTLES